MICKTCVHCGLCEGDGNSETIPEKSVCTEFFPGESLSKENAAFSDTDIGIAFDIGTTTIAASGYFLRTGKKIVTAGQENFQREYGADVISRISFGLTDEGFKALHEIVLIQINALSQRIISAACKLNDEKSVCLKNLVIAGNTVMESIVYGQKIDGFAAFPFNVNNFFGVSVKAGNYFNKKSCIPSDCDIYFAPVVSAFAGSDCICSVSACIQHQKKLPEKRYVITVDLGTNCEIAMYDMKENKMICTSTAAGPAFEGQGISSGMPCMEGAVAGIEKTGDGFSVKVIGNTTAQGICGTGLISAVSVFNDSSLIDEGGAIVSGESKIVIVPEALQNNQKEICITQKDIRNFQLAKGAVKAGLEIITEQSSAFDTCSIFTAGGFSNSLHVNDLFSADIIPGKNKDNVYLCGNAALQGASMILLDDDFKDFSENLAKNAVYIDLALKDDFQTKFINALNFKRI